MDFSTQRMNVRDGSRNNVSILLHVFGNISLSLEFLRPYISLHINRGIDVGFIPGIESWKILFQKLFDAR